MNKAFMNEHSPEILVGLGIGTMLTGVFMACRATIKAQKKLEKRKKDLKTEQLTVKETIKTAGPCYIGTAITEMGGAYLVGKGLGKSLDRTASVATALAIEEAARRSFEEKAEEVLGEKKVKEIRDEVAREQNNNSPLVITKKDGKKIFVDTLVDKEFFLNSVNELDKLQLEVEMDIVNYNFISVNDWLRRIGVKTLDDALFDELGWGPATGFELHRTWIETDDGEPCCLVSHPTTPKPRKEAEGCW